MSGALLDVAFALGGGLGAVARHWLGCRLRHRLPLSTLAVNVLGSLVLGATLATIDGGGELAAETPHRLLVGFCGGFTTFSSFAVQSIELVRDRHAGYAAANIVLNVVLCVAAFCLPLVFSGTAAVSVRE